MKKYLFPSLIALSALSISAAAAFYSVTGLSMLFAGVSTAVIWMASSLEVSKLVIASLLYQYKKVLSFSLKLYFTSALIVLMGITSAGIYGYLSSGYQSTSDKVNVVNKEIALIDNKLKNKEIDKTFITEQLKQTQENITQLRNALGNNNQTYKDKDGNIFTTSSSANRKSYEKQLDITIKNEEQLSKKLNSIDSTISVLSEDKLNKESNSELKGELGPLKYISNLTGKSMDQIINWFLLVIILVFDPLAIFLVIAANIAFNQIKKPEPKIEEPISFKNVVSEPIHPEIGEKLENNQSKSWQDYVPSFMYFKKKN